jgi:thioredoxin:protein disulfide reductase
MPALFSWCSPDGARAATGRVCRNLSQGAESLWRNLQGGGMVRGLERNRSPMKDLRRVSIQWLSMCLWAAAALWALGRPAYAQQEFLDPAAAFRLGARAVSERVVELRFDIAPGYYLYREPLAFTAPPDVRLGQAEVPPGLRKHDPNFDKEVETYHDRLTVRLPVEAAGPRFVLKVRSQGCAEKGICYPPQDQEVDVSLAGFGGNGSASLVTAAAPASAGGWLRGGAPGPSSEPGQMGGDPIERVLRAGQWLPVIGAFLLAGLLLSFTPCVLPMLPILSSIIVGQGQAPGSRGRGLGLAASYALGMALVYTALGVLAGLAGEGLAANLQKPAVLLGFAALLAVLALSMFGVYELQLPVSWQSRVQGWSSRLPGGRFLSVMLMGGLSALIVSPCVAAPLAGALLYISQTRDVLLGGTALFALAAGMSVPLLVLGASAGRWLPRAGAWMESVKAVFGFLLLGVAVWVAQPALSQAWIMGLWGGWLAAIGIWLWRLSRGLRRPLQRRGAGLGAALALGAGMLMGVGVATGAHDVWAPWAGLTGQAAAPGDGKRLAFVRVASVAELDRQLAGTTQPVMLDFYADWCVSCKEMERFTFSDPAVHARLQQALVLQADVTANSAEDKALLKRFHLFGPPGIVFFDARGQLLERVRVIGFQGPERFQEALTASGL